MKPSRAFRILIALCVSSMIAFSVGCVDQSAFPQDYLNDALLSAASDGRESEVIGFLTQGANVNSRSEGERTPLVNAAANNHVGIVKVLLQHGATVNAQDHNGDTALDVTSSNEIRRLLKSKGGKRGDKSKVVPH